MRGSLSSWLQTGLNLKICLSIGWRWSYRYLLSLTWLYLLVQPSQRRGIGRCLAVALPRRGWWSRQVVMQKIFRGIGVHYFEKLFNVYCPAAVSLRFFQTHVHDEGLDVIRQGLTRGRGVLLVTGHLGGVEFLPGFLGFHRLPVSVVVRFASQRLRSISTAKAAAFGITIIDADRTANIVRAILSELSRNRVVITQCDEIDEWRPGKQEQIDFLGKRIYMDRTLTVLIKRQKPEVAFAVMRRCDEGYRFVALPAGQIPTLHADWAGLSIGAALLRLLERYVIAYPEQWYLWKKMDQLQPLAVANDTPGLPAPIGKGQEPAAAV